MVVMIFKIILVIVYLFFGFICLSVYESWNIDGADDMAFIVVLVWPLCSVIILFVLLLALGNSAGKRIVKWLDKIMGDKENDDTYDL